MEYKTYQKRPESNLIMELNFWRAIKGMIKDGGRFTYKTIGDDFLKKFGYRVTKKNMADKRSLFFNEKGFAYFNKL